MCPADTLNKWGKTRTDTEYKNITIFYNSYQIASVGSLRNALFFKSTGQQRESLFLTVSFYFFFFFFVLITTCRSTCPTRSAIAASCDLSTGATTAAKLGQFFPITFFVFFFFVFFSFFTLQNYNSIHIFSSLILFKPSLKSYSPNLLFLLHV